MNEERKPYGVIRSAMVILPELRDGQVVTELSGAIHDALAAVRQHNKAAEVILRVKIEPATEQRLVEAPIAMTATIETKLPKEVPPGTIFFVDESGNPTRQMQRQQQMPFGVAPSNTANGA